MGVESNWSAGGAAGGSGPGAAPARSQRGQRQGSEMKLTPSLITLETVLFQAHRLYLKLIWYFVVHKGLEFIELTH